MKLQGKQAERFARAPDPEIWACLIFGEDDGVCSDLVAALRQKWAGKEGAQLITLNEDDVRRDPASLFDALEAQSLLGDKRILKVRTSGDKIAKILIDALNDGESTAAPRETKLIIQAGALKKRSKLRTTYETSKRGAALHVFADEASDVAALVQQKLNADGIAIEPAALDYFIAELPGHRGLANQEIEKLCLYGRGLGHPLTLDDVKSVARTDADAVLHELVAAALSGELDKTVRMLDRLLIAGSSPITVLRALQRETQRLLTAQGLAGEGGDIGMKLKPPVFRNMWPAFRNRMQIWPAQRLLRLLERIHDTEANAKLGGALAEPGLRDLVVSVAKTAAMARQAQSRR